MSPSNDFFFNLTFSSLFCLLICEKNENFHMMVLFIYLYFVCMLATVVREVCIFYFDWILIVVLVVDLFKF